MLIACACGCGEMIQDRDGRNRPRKFVWGHHNKIRVFPEGHFEYLKGNTQGFKKGQAPWNKGLKGYMAGEKNHFFGKKHDEATLEKMRGENNGNWKGGVSIFSDALRRSSRYKQWRKAVLIRDNYRCVLCGSEDSLQADHINSFADYPELRLELSNGRTLCESCHKATPSYGFSKQRKGITLHA